MMREHHKAAHDFICADPTWFTKPVEEAQLRTITELRYYYPGSWRDSDIAEGLLKKLIARQKAQANVDHAERLVAEARFSLEANEKNLKAAQRRLAQFTDEF